MKKKTKGVISFFIGIILMFSIIVSIISLFFKFNVLNQATYLKVLKTNNIYSEINESIQNNISIMLSINNIGSEVKDSLISVEEIQQTVDKLVIEIVDYLNTSESKIENINKDVYKERFREALNKYINDNGIFITESLNMEIDNLTNDVGDIIENELQVININVINESNTIKKITFLTSLFSSKLYLIAVGASIIIIISLLLLWKKKFDYSLKWIGNGFISGGLFIFIIFFSGYISGFYENIIISTGYLKVLVSNIIKSYLVGLSIFGLISIMIGFILMIPSIRKSILKSTRRSMY